MADVHTSEQRSFNMSRINGKDTKPEMLVRKILHNRGVRFRLHRKDLAGKPDIVLPKYKSVIFVHGCFWHQHQNCKRAKLPSTNKDFWQEKLSRNVERDLKNHCLLQAEGWHVLEVWECELKANPEKAVEKILADLNVILNIE